MKFLALSALPLAVAALDTRAAPDVVAPLTKAIQDANTQANTCVTAIKSFHTQGVTSKAALEINCLPIDDKFSAIDTALKQWSSITDPADIKAMEPIGPSLTALLKTLNIMESSVPGTGNAALALAACKLVEEKSDVGYQSSLVLKELAAALTAGNILPDVAKGSDEFAEKILKAVEVIKVGCISVNSTSPATGTTSTTGPSPTSTGGVSGNGTNSGSGSGLNPVKTGAAAGLGPQVMVALLAVVGAVFML